MDVCHKSVSTPFGWCNLLIVGVFVQWGWAGDDGAPVQQCVQRPQCRSVLRPAQLLRVPGTGFRNAKTHRGTLRTAETHAGIVVSSSFLFCVLALLCHIRIGDELLATVAYTGRTIGFYTDWSDQIYEWVSDDLLGNCRIRCSMWETVKQTINDFPDMLFCAMFLNCFCYKRTTVNNFPVDFTCAVAATKCSSSSFGKKLFVLLFFHKRRKQSTA